MNSWNRNWVPEAIPNPSCICRRQHRTEPDRINFKGTKPPDAIKGLLAHRNNHLHRS